MKKIIKYVFCSLCFILISTNVFANHNHTNECFLNVTQHICDGNNTTYGNCYTTPLTHKHNNDCYDKKCYGGDFDVIHTPISICDKCGYEILKETITCKKCNITNEYTACSNESCSQTSVPNFEQSMKHNELSIEQAQLQNKTICNLEENEIVGYEKSCTKTSGQYYDENGNIAQPKCHLIVKSYKPEIEQATINNFSNRVLVEYLDGHTDYVVGYSEFENLDKTISYENYPVTITFSALLQGNSIPTEQTTICYFTNIVENNDELETIEKQKEFETVEKPNVIEKEDINIEQDISTKITPTPTEIIQEETTPTPTIIENNETQTTVVENTTSTSTIITTTIIIIGVFVLIFIAINVIILMKKNKK